MAFTFSLIFKSILSRLIFLGHGIAAVYLFVDKRNNPKYWALVIPLVCLVIESIVTIVYRKGKEYKYFWPSGFFYISCFIPIIWLIELDLYDERTSFGNTKMAQANFSSLTSVEQEKLNAEIFINGIDGKKNSVLTKVSEVGLIIGIIIGRWLMPRGEMSKEQLSALLLLYVSNAADILELFAAFEEPEILNNRDVIIAIIFIFTWAIYQFSLVATITTKKETVIKRLIKKESRSLMYTGKELRVKGIEDLYINSVRTRLNTASSITRVERGKGRKQSVMPARKMSQIMPVNEGATHQKTKVLKYREIHGETFQILVTLLMQDGPFLVLRLYLSLQFQVASEMHIFFTCKNAIVSILLIYRLLVLSCTGEDKESNWHREEAESRLQNIQIALEDMKLNEVAKATSKIFVR